MFVQNCSDSFGVLHQNLKKGGGEGVKKQTICWGWEEFWEGI